MIAIFLMRYTMLRSIIAIIVAVVAGMFVARFFEIVVGAAFAPAGGAQGAVTAGHQLLLVVGWTIAAFAAAALSLLIGKRWAPLGWLGAATICLLAVISIASAAVSWLLWPGAIAGAGFGGWSAVKLLRGDYTHPARRDLSAR